MNKIILWICCLFSVQLCAEIVVDNNYTPKNTRQTFVQNSRPVVLIDEAHHNYHTVDGRYQPFVKVLKSDGYTIQKNSKPFSKASLANADILVIANALNEKNIENWDLPNYPAFTRSEVEAIYHWVKAGGSLLLIADHLPWPKASASLAAIFGFQFHNGYVEIVNSSEQFFDRADGTLAQHAILTGVNNSKPIQKVRGFFGQGFLPPPNAEPLLIFGKDAVAYMPTKSWQFPDGTPEISAIGWSQGATLEFHGGRVAVFGEAGMFTAQIGIEDNEQWNMGMNAKGAEQNEQFLLNVMHWLSKKI